MQVQSQAGVKGDAGPFSLYDDVLRVVLGLLPLCERARVASVSAQWNRVTTTSAINGSCVVHIHRWSDVTRLGRSAVARNHIEELSFDQLAWPSCQDLSDFLAPLPSFRCLTCICMQVRTQPPESLARILRRCSTLRKIRLPPFESRNTAFMRSLLVSRCPMLQLRDIGVICLDSSLATIIPRCAPNLTILYADTPERGSITQSLPVLLPHLHHLKTISIRGRHAVVIHANLFAHMTRNSLRRIMFTTCTISESMVEWLMSLPALSFLVFDQCVVPNFSAFAHPTLATFNVWNNDYPSAWLPQRERNPSLVE